MPSIINNIISSLGSVSAWTRAKINWLCGNNSEDQTPLLANDLEAGSSYGINVDSDNETNTKKTNVSTQENIDKVLKYSGVGCSFGVFLILHKGQPVTQTTEALLAILRVQKWKSQLVADVLNIIICGMYAAVTVALNDGAFGDLVNGREITHQPGIANVLVAYPFLLGCGLNMIATVFDIWGYKKIGEFCRFGGLFCNVTGITNLTIEKAQDSPFASSLPWPGIICGIGEQATSVLQYVNSKSGPITEWIYKEVIKSINLNVNISEIPEVVVDSNKPLNPVLPQLSSQISELQPPFAFVVAKSNSEQSSSDVSDWEDSAQGEKALKLGSRRFGIASCNNSEQSSSDVSDWEDSAQGEKALKLGSRRFGIASCNNSEQSSSDVSDWEDSAQGEKALKLGSHRDEIIGFKNLNSSVWSPFSSQTVRVVNELQQPSTSADNCPAAVSSFKA